MDSEGKKGFWSRELSTRGIGILALCCGLGLAYMSILKPLLDASNGAQSVSMSLKGTIITPMIITIGIIYTFWEEKGKRLLGPPQQPTLVGWLIDLACIAIGIGVYFWLKYHLCSYGYSV